MLFIKFPFFTDKEHTKQNDFEKVAESKYTKTTISQWSTEGENKERMKTITIKG